MRFKIAYAYTGREICVSKSIGLAYCWKEICNSNLQLVFTETRLKDVDSAMPVLCLYGPRKSMPRLKSEISKQQYTMTLFNYKHLVHVKVLWQMQKFMSYCTVFALFILNLRAISAYKPPGACVCRGDLRYQFGGLIFGGAYVRNLTVFK